MELARPKFRADASWILPLAGLALVATLAATVHPQTVFYLMIGAVGVSVLVWQPHVGVGAILALLLVEYRERVSDLLSSLVPAGSGLLSVNNGIGLLLGVLLVYRVYSEQDWSFLRSRQVQLILLIAVAFVISGLLSSVNIDEMVALGLREKGQDPTRFVFSRALFVLFFVAFVRGPRALRLMIGIFLVLALASALGGVLGVLTGLGYRGEGPGAVAGGGYRAGGYGIVIKVARNPNRLALACSIALVFVWEYGQVAWQYWRRVVSMATVSLLALTVFLTASRGSVVSLLVSAYFLLAGRGQGMRRAAYGAMVALAVAMLIVEFMPELTAERLSAIPGVTEVTGETGAGSVYRRQYGWQVALRICAAHPLIGVGLDNYPYVRFEEDPMQLTSPPHNSYLEVLAEGGIVVLSLYFMLFWLSVTRLRQIENDPSALQRVREDGLEWILRGTRYALMSFLVFSLFADLWTQVIFYLLVGSSAVLIGAYGSAPPRYEHA
jgi:O-antigen ligase